MAKKKTNTTKTTPNTPLSDEAMQRLAEVMNDSPTTIKLKGTDFEIHALKPGTQWLIAEEACKILQKEKMSMGDVLKEFSGNMGAVCRVIALAILNDKERINSDEYQRLYDQLMWGDYEVRDWATLLFQILQMLDVDFFFASTNVVKTLRQQTLTRKTTMEELESSPAARNGGR